MPRCPLRLTCVNSCRDTFRLQRVEPFAVVGDPAAAFRLLKVVVAESERTEIVTATDDYLRAECRSRRGFVDDLEFRLAVREPAIHVRSASRTWYALCDFGVNRRRVEALRQRFRKAAELETSGD